MTRINLIPPSELADQHLFAEFREIKMVPKALARSLRARGVAGVQSMIPWEFCLGQGHVGFFYNKGAYLRERYWDIREELVKRRVNFDVNSAFDPDKIFETYSVLNGHYTPTKAALKLIRARIAEKIAMKPDWYRWTKP